MVHNPNNLGCFHIKVFCISYPKGHNLVDERKNEHDIKLIIKNLDTSIDNKKIMTSPKTQINFLSFVNDSNQYALKSYCTSKANLALYCYIIY
jgi:hypothetical protein